MEIGIGIKKKEEYAERDGDELPPFPMLDFKDEIMNYIAGYVTNILQYYCSYCLAVQYILQYTSDNITILQYIAILSSSRLLATSTSGRL